MYRTFQTIAVLAVLTLGASAVHAVATPAEKCAAAKQKAIARKIAAKLGCYAKAASKGVPVDTICLTKATAAFSKAFTAAEKHAGCAINGDAVSQEVAVDATVGEFAASEGTSQCTTLLQPCGTTCGGSGRCFPRCGLPGEPLGCVDVSTADSSASCSDPFACQAAQPGAICVESGVGLCGLATESACAQPCP